MREKQTGMTDPRLEVGRPWREKVTPTTDKDIKPGARVYMRLLETAVTHTMALEGCNGDGTNPFYQQQQEALRTVRDEVRQFGFNQEGFDLVTQEKIRQLKERQKEEAEDADLQSRLGDVPPNTNWGNHSFKKG